jgi:hypothetical protein
MRVPEDRTDRLDETIYSQLRTLADAEQAGADVAPIAETLLGTLSPLSPFQIEAWSGPIALLATLLSTIGRMSHGRGGAASSHFWIGFLKPGQDRAQRHRVPQRQL